MSLKSAQPSERLHLSTRPSCKPSLWVLALILLSLTASAWSQESTGTNSKPVLLKGHTQAVTALAFSPDGKWLASSGRDETVRVWDVATWQEISTLPGRNGIFGISVSPDGRWLAAVSYQEVTIWETSTWKGKGVLKLGEDFLGCNVVFGPDSTTMVLVSLGATSSIRWNMDTQRPLGRWDRAVGGGSCPGPTFSPDGKFLATIGMKGADKEGIDPYKLIVAKQKLLVLTVEKGKEVLVIEKKFANPAFTLSPDGHRVVISEKGWIDVWDIPSRKRVLSMDAGIGEISALAISYAPNWLAAGGMGKLKILDLDTKKEVHVMQLKGSEIRALAFSRDGSWLASGSEDGTVAAWGLRIAP